MNKSNISNIANHIKQQLPDYIASDEDYSKFVKFLELYYEWMSEVGNPSDVTGDLTNYADIDETLDIFVSLYKNELASSFPSVTKIKGIVDKNNESIQGNQVGKDAESAIESLYDQEFLMDGSTTSFKLNYFNPFYYFGETDATSVVDSIVVYKNLATDVANRGTTANTLESWVAALTPPETSRSGSSGDYTVLQEHNGTTGQYKLANNIISFINDAGNPDAMLTDDIVKIRFYIKTYADPSTTPDTEDGIKRLVESTGQKKTTYENQQQFLKFMKDFYQSKGSEKSYDFLFRAIFNEPIEIYYPKNHLFKSSNNTWTKTKSVRAIPYVKTPLGADVSNPYRIDGKTSGASATVEYYKDFKLGTYDVREYFLTNITGTFSSKEIITISQQDNTTYEETLYECVIGFDITNAGSDYSRNQPLHYNLTSSGSGYGFAAQIDHTSRGDVESIQIGNGGDGYIVGEEIKFEEGATLGTGAAGKVTGTTSTLTDYSVLFNQNPESSEYIANGPQKIFDIGLSGNPYHSTAANTSITIENIDFKYNSVFGLFNFESIDNSIITKANDIMFYGSIPDIKSNKNGIRRGTSLVSTVKPPSNISNINPTDALDTRYKNDLILSVTSIDATGAITGVTTENSISGADGTTLSTALAGKVGTNAQVLPSPVNLKNQSGKYESGNGFGAKFDISVTGTGAGRAATITLGPNATQNSPTTHNVTLLHDWTSSTTGRYTLSGAFSGINADFTVNQGDTILFAVDGITENDDQATWIKHTLSSGTSDQVNSNAGFGGAALNGGTPDGTITWIARDAGTFYYVSDNDINASGSITVVTNPVVSGGGFQYLENDTLKLDGKDIGGISGTNDVDIKVLTVSSGTAYPNIILEDTVNNVVGYTTNSNNGINAKWNVNTDMSPYPRRFAVRLSDTPLSSGYKVNDTFTIPGTLLGGLSPSNDLTIIVDQVDATGRIQEFSASGVSASGAIATFSVIGTPTLPDAFASYYLDNLSYSYTNSNAQVGFGAKFFVTRNGTTYHVGPPSSLDRGTNYSVGDRIDISGAVLDGDASTNILRFNVTVVDGVGGIMGVSAPFLNTDGSGTSVAINTYSLTDISSVSNLGLGAEFDIDIVNDLYIATVSAGKGGSGYNVGQILTFSGTSLAYQWIRDGFTSKVNIVGDTVLNTESGYMRLNDIGELFRSNSTGGTTIDFWYFRKGTEISSSYNGASIFSINDSIGGIQKTFLQQNADGTLGFGYGNTTVLTTAAIAFGVWHHIGVHFSSTHAYVYVNGEIAITVANNNYFDISEYGDYIETITITSSNLTGISKTYDQSKPVTIDVNYTTGPSSTKLVSVAGVHTDGTTISWPTLSVGDVVTLSYSKPKKNFYLGARQKVDSNYVVEDYNHAFFGTLRFTEGQRYDHIGSNIQDTGTDNPVSGVGLNPIYVNPIPSKRSIRKTTTKKVKFTVSDLNKSSFNLEYDLNHLPIITRGTVSTNGLGEEVITTTNLFAPGELDSGGNAVTAQYSLTQALDSDSNPISSLGSAIVFSPDLGIGERIEITYWTVVQDDLEYLVFNENHPVSANKISLRQLLSTGIYTTYALPDGYSLRVTWNSKSKSPIDAVSVTATGGGYMKKPFGTIAKQTGEYLTQGQGAWFKGEGKDIGNIQIIGIAGNPIETEKDGHGVGYDTAPVLDLAEYGDGLATATVLTGALCERTGEALNDEGFLSHDNRFYDGYLWQEYSYVIKVGRYVDEWRKIVKKLVHPAGLMMFGEYSLYTDAEVRKGAGLAWTQLFYEIIKNINMKVKNMDGLGQWAYGETDEFWYPTPTRQDTNYLNSHGNIFTYDNRQLTINSSVDAMYNGVGEGEVSDDTAGATTVDTGSGRYALLQADDTNAPGGWWQVKKIAFNFKDAAGKDYSHYYTSGLIGNTVTVYDVSDVDLVQDDFINTRPWGKYKITGALIDSSVGERYVVYNVDYISGYTAFTPTWDNADTGTGGPNKVEFRWDNVFRGNVDRGANHWIGSQLDGANPRDEKMVINISGRYNNNKEGDVPTLHTTWKSLERFKFYFRDIYPYRELVQQMFSPASEMIGSPYNVHRKLVQGNNLTHVAVRPNSYNMWYNLPVEADGTNEWIANTDGTDHKWRNTVMTDVVTKSDRKYRAVLDSTINILPVYLVMSEENINSGTRKRMGPTNLSVERAKFNNKVQPSLDYNVDRIDYDENLLDLNTVDKFTSPGTVHDKSNFASESTLVKYATVPTTLAELTEILNTSAID